MSPRDAESEGPPISKRLSPVRLTCRPLNGRRNPDDFSSLFGASLRRGAPRSARLPGLIRQEILADSFTVPWETHSLPCGQSTVPRETHSLLCGHRMVLWETHSLPCGHRTVPRETHSLLCGHSTVPWETHSLLCGHRTVLWERDSLPCSHGMVVWEIPSLPDGAAWFLWRYAVKTRMMNKCKQGLNNGRTEDSAN